MDADALGFWDSIARDLSGPGKFRLILQPTLAILLGLRLGVADAKEGRSPFFFRMFTERHHGLELFKQSLSDAALPLAICLVMDAILQHITLGHIRPAGALVVGAILVWIPYALARGLINRFWRRFGRSPQKKPA